MTTSPNNENNADGSLNIRIGHEELVIRQRYEVVSICNDIVIAIWFIVGSVLFFSESTTFAATWLFLIGSVQMMIRPGIRLARRVHLQNIGAQTSHETSMDF